MTELTAERARELFDYDPETGLVTRRVDCGNRRKGRAAGSTRPDGRMSIQVDGKSYYSARIIWLLVTGSWPLDCIDHINGNNKDNRWANLREATRRLNNENKHKPNKNNRCGILGVSYNEATKKFISKIRVGGKLLYIGKYDDPSEAYQAYLEEKRKLHKGCTI